MFENGKTYEMVIPGVAYYRRYVVKGEDIKVDGEWVEFYVPHIRRHIHTIKKEIKIVKVT